MSREPSRPIPERNIRVLVCGGRNYNDRAAVYRELDDLERSHGITLVIHGGAPGADDLAESWAISRCVPHRWFTAEWTRLGKAAGPARNARMLAEGKPDVVLAFPGGRGTADSEADRSEAADLVRRALEAGVEVIRVLP